MKPLAYAAAGVGIFMSLTAASTATKAGPTISRTGGVTGVSQPAQLPVFIASTKLTAESGKKYDCSWVIQPPNNSIPNFTVYVKGPANSTIVITNPGFQRGFLGTTKIITFFAELNTPAPGNYSIEVTSQDSHLILKSINTYELKPPTHR
jgi:hypothetical protein